jgi:hypothetical protein
MPQPKADQKNLMIVHEVFLFSGIGPMMGYWHLPG